MTWSPWASSSQRDARWADREPSLGEAAGRARELLLAGGARPLPTLMLCFALALAAAAAFVVLRPDHAPRFVLRVVEPNTDPTTLPRTRRRLAEYVKDGVLTSEALLGVIDRHGLYPALRWTNTPAAVESFREDITLEVHQNYFLEERTAAEAPRSARLSVSYRSKDPELALAVTRELGRLIVERERGARKRQAEVALARAADALERSGRTLVQHRAEIARQRARLRYATEPDALGEARLVSLLGSLEWRERELERAQTRKAALELGSSRESRWLGLAFETVDEGSVPKSEERSVTLALWVGVASFVAALPFAAALMGAFAPKRGVP